MFLWKWLKNSDARKKDACPYKVGERISFIIYHGTNVIEANVMYRHLKSARETGALIELRDSKKRLLVEAVEMVSSDNIDSDDCVYEITVKGRISK